MVGTLILEMSEAETKDLHGETSAIQNDRTESKANKGQYDQGNI